MEAHLAPFTRSQPGSYPGHGIASDKPSWVRFPARHMNIKEMMVKRLLDGETISNYKEGGNSMVPLIRHRQPVDIKPVDRPLKVGDIVFAKVSGRYYTHLVSALDRDRVQISNNHGHINGWTHKSKVFGLVTPSDQRKVTQ